MLWNHEKIKLKPRYGHKPFLHAKVTMDGGKVWELIALYASPHTNIHKLFWGKINEMRIEHPWLVIGDFNCVIREEERNSGREVSSFFVDGVSQRGLIDLGYVGPAFTWNQGNNVDTRRST